MKNIYLVKNKKKIFVFDKCSSTMDVGWKLFKEGELKEGDSVFAYEQTKGRGQFRRKWISKKGNIYVSWLWKAFPWEERLISLGIGVLLCKALNQLNVPVKIKWPNDLILKEKKVGGILVEERYNCFLVGIGLNLNFCPKMDELEREGLFPPGNLREVVSEQDPFLFWIKLKSCCMDLISQLDLFAGEEFQAQLNKYLAFCGKKVLVWNGTEQIEGRIVGVNFRGELELFQDREISQIGSGTIIKVLE
ncbi:biotin--[acetyl-CoA-carboxylase] ligase [Desulfonauticus submarinus]|nr:biotin--[acetyl-CoA-carboxylase] ligase [Desulfonauticus submarinus]